MVALMMGMPPSAACKSGATRLFGLIEAGPHWAMRMAHPFAMTSVSREYQPMRDRTLSIIAIFVSVCSLYISHQDSQTAITSSQQANQIAQAAQFDAQRANDIAQQSLNLTVREASAHQPRLELKSCSYGTNASRSDEFLEIALTRTQDAWANDTTPAYSMPSGVDVSSCLVRNSGDRAATNITIEFPYEYVGWRGVPVKKSDELLVARHGHISIAALQPGEEVALELYNADPSFAVDMSMGDAIVQYQFGSMAAPLPQTLYRTSLALGRLCPPNKSCTKDRLAQL